MHGYKLPKKAVKVKELATIKEINVSNNPINIVAFKNLKNTEGMPQIGYFKRINEKKDLPEILGKISVAISTYLRTTKGIAEERLVYDKNNKIIGTVSLELPGFVQFQGMKDEELKDKNQQELANPTPEMVLKSRFIKKMVKGLIHHNYDFGPHNCGLHWLLDFEYFFPELTSIFKGERFNIDIHLFGYNLRLLDLDPIDKVIELTSEILRTFKTRLPYFPGETPKNHVSKREFKTTAFKELLENEKYIPEAIDQRYDAYLEELLLFDPEIIKKRLTEYLGDEKLNLTQLPLEQQIALKKLDQTHLREKKLLYLKDAGIDFKILCLQKPDESEKNFKKRLANILEIQEKLLNLDPPLLQDNLINLLKKLPISFKKLSSQQKEKLHDFRKGKVIFQKILTDENNKERSFVDFFLVFISHRHEKFRRVIIDMPELREHLVKLKTPQLASILKPTENCDDSEEVFSRFSRYQKIVSDSFKEPILTYVNDLTETASEDIGFSEIMMPKEDIIDLSLSCASIELPYIHKSKKAYLKDDIHRDLQKLTIAIKNKCQLHFSLKNPNFEENKQFVNDLTKLLQLAQNKKSYYEAIISRNKMNHLELSEITIIFQKLNEIIIHFNQTLIDYSSILSSAKTAEKLLEKNCGTKIEKKAQTSKSACEEEFDFFEEESQIISVQEEKESLYATNDKELIPKLIDVLKTWLPMPEQFIKPLISKAYEEYKINISSYAKIFSKSRTLTSFDPISIFSSGGWENNSMNTLLIKHICLAASGKNFLNSILHKKDKDWWAQYAKELAIGSNLYDPKQKTGLSKSAFI